MEADTSVEFVLPARVENVALVRHALSGLAEVYGMDAEVIADLKTVVTEACSNVVTHAYEPDEIGELRVVAGVDGEQVVVTVIDSGRGIRPLADVEGRSLRLGLPLIAALTDGLELGTSPGSGTTVTMRMRIAASSNGHGVERDRGETPPTQIDIATGRELSPVLSRVISMFATRADLTVDRLADVVLLSDAISAGGAEGFPDGTARLQIAEEDGAFEVRFGPLAEGGARRLVGGMRIPELGASLETLAEEVRIDEDDGGEFLVIRIGTAA